ncbi:ClpXP protease specificity-enhancing factor [Stutzerimonas kirkiae]|uniref:ClpXP protease specificity-enhancing factor n=1 Tax=Stutzerimonas kirkiae TaxID=2211392 RepID=A0A4V6MX73_9GAMM|nr:ClpXP protease specificity-enhancing factor [Stutzerimonas kirkiae]TBU88505.1 ClpXP protease specificity-enhancing factor [Stutzerimonas kirkiae]TBU99502.1 ClpXP protease specificity-enhancing factor [Stutzerimonas kirkiae]TBV10415.1 ClpXP protease specificity-enhancing factor [Stutzerimonas kirkiae]TBV14030.1 ClpXP protease specificity-enhancing factor [Stutzerimonas kirkiae]
MTSSRPYLLRALYEWLVDNSCTPHLLVDAEFNGVRVPAGFAQDGQIVLNVSPQATRHMHMDNAAVSFEARFGGVPQQLHVPVAAILAIYARENGQGMVFEVEEEPEPTPPEDTTPEPPTTAKPAGRPSLKVVK